MPRLGQKKKQNIIPKAKHDEPRFGVERAGHDRLSSAGVRQVGVRRGKVLSRRAEPWHGGFGQGKPRYDKEGSGKVGTGLLCQAMER